MLLMYFHGEGVLFSFFIQVFLGVLGVAVLLVGLLKYKSMPAVIVAVGYAAITLVVAFVSRGIGDPRLEIAAWVLTLPWNAIVPCYNLDRSCSLTLAVSGVCATLNAAIVYFLVVWISRPLRRSLC